MKCKLVAFLSVIISIHASAQDRNISYLSSGGPLKPLQANMDIRHYTLALDIDIPNESIKGSNTIDLILAKPTDTLLFDLLHFYKVSRISVGNKNKPFQQLGDSIFITGSGGFKAGKQSVKIEYEGKPPVAVRPPWKGGFSWKKDGAGNPWVVINCQFEGGKVYFPCKDHPSDEPDEGADLFITVPKGLIVAGPGLLQKRTTAGNKETFHWKTNYTISNYCILFNIGKYVVEKDVYTTVAGNKVPVDFYVIEEDKAMGKKIVEMRKRDAAVLEKYFGEYPWPKEKMGIAQVPNPGMEHQTMITYGDVSGSKFKFHKVGNWDYSDNLYHEFAHEWFANKVTNKDWAHMWIQEGITTYSEALFCREAAGERGYDSMMVAMKAGIANKTPIVQGEGLSTAKIYHNDIYVKGAFFMHTLRYVLGDELFFPALKMLATDPQYTYSNFVTTDDVEQLFSKAAGKDLKPLFNFYLRTTDLLNIEVRQRRFNQYEIRTTNQPITFSIDVLTDHGTEKITLSDKWQTVKSNIPPAVDPRGFYLKTVKSN